MQSAGKMTVNTISMVSYRPPQRIFPLSLLAQLMSRYASCCLQVSSGSTTWSIYLEEGKLVYATNSASPFGRLDRHLYRLSRQVPALVSAVRVQIRLLFEAVPINDYTVTPDYQAICWLIQQQYLDVAQANQLIEIISKEVLESFLTLTQGNYRILEKERFDDYPSLGQFDLREMVEQCQAQIQQQQSDERSNDVPAPQSKSTPPSVPNLKVLNTRFSPSTPGSKSPISEPTVKEKFAGSSPAKSHYTIACIDDSRTVLESIKNFLDDDSFSVLMISDPVKALMEVVRSKPDLILLDVGMPNLDGYELCSLLRRHPHFKQTPIVMVTGHTGFIDRAKAKLVGATGYLTKPFTQSDLLKVVFKNLT
jgi:twitching motility two-component system response regulator PilG